MLPYLWSRSGRGMPQSGRRSLCHLVSDPLILCGALTNSWLSDFGTPVLLKHKADEIDASMAPFPSQPPLPPQSPPLPPVAKRPRRNRELMCKMWGLLRTGARWLDTLRGAQMAAQEASGVMAAAMLRQQGAMREISMWELEVEDAMREMSKVVDEVESDL